MKSLGVALLMFAALLTGCAAVTSVLSSMGVLPPHNSYAVAEAARQVDAAQLQWWLAILGYGGGRMLEGGTRKAVGAVRRRRKPRAPVDSTA